MFFLAFSCKAALLLPLAAPFGLAVPGGCAAANASLAFFALLSAAFFLLTAACNRITLKICVDENCETSALCIPVLLYTSAYFCRRVRSAELPVGSSTSPHALRPIASSTS